MPGRKSITQIYVGLFLLGCFLFSFPVLTIFNHPTPVFGIPMFFFYLFCAWGLLIFLIMRCTRLHRTRPGPAGQTES